MPPAPPGGGRVDPFDLLGLPPTFDLSPADVRRAWIARSAGVHPDHAGPGDGETARRAAELNDARRLLEDPERRAITLLERLAGPGATKLPGLAPHQLAEALEMQECVESARAEGRPLEGYERVGLERRAEHVRRVSALFRDLGGATPAPAGPVEGLRRELAAWRYTERLLEQFDPDRTPGAWPAGGPDQGVGA